MAARKQRDADRLPKRFIPIGLGFPKVGETIMSQEAFDSDGRIKDYEGVEEGISEQAHAILVGRRNELLARQ